jgi:hypothetical protein
MAALESLRVRFALAPARRPAVAGSGGTRCRDELRVIYGLLRGAGGVEEAGRGPERDEETRGEQR